MANTKHRIVRQYTDANGITYTVFAPQPSPKPAPARAKGRRIGAGHYRAGGPN